ncbi:MAG: repeat-containing protein [Acidobacteria bacterium]|nr:repeat-containing protein [Acidobacteriota bacterium]
MSDNARSLAYGCVIVLAGVLTYANSLSGPMVFDDFSAIARNTQIRHLWPPIDALAAPRDNELASRPLVNLSFAINYAFGGLSVPGYHGVNVAVHIVTTLLLFGIIRRTLTTAGLRTGGGSGPDGIALASAVIWMVHPLLTESIDYLTQRTELLMAMFYLLTLYCAIRAAQADNAGAWRAGAILSCLLGMGCKETMATAPLVVVLYDRVFLFGSWREAWQRRRGLYAGLALGWIALAALLFSSLPPTIGFGSRISGWTYLLNQCSMILRYLRLTIWPRGLVIDYGVPHPLRLTDVLPQAIAVTAIAALTGFALIVRPTLGFLGAWFFITLAPASSVIPVMTEVGAERRMYLPLMGLAVLVVVGAGRLLDAAGSRKTIAATMTASAVIATLALATIQRNREYASPVVLLQTTVDRWPHGRSRFNLAGALKDAGRVDEAITQFRAAAPEQPRALYEIGSILFDRRQFGECVTPLRAFVERLGGRPGTTYQRVLAGNLIALSLAEQGKRSESVAEFQSALQLDPDNPDLHGNLGFILLQQRDFDGARAHYEQLLLHRPPNAFVLTNLGIALQALGRVQEAKRRFHEALALDPRNPEARRRLAELAAAQDAH